MLQQNQFANITHLFYSGEYEEGEKEISKVIRRQNNNSNIYVNRALFLSQLGRDEQAILDLEKALHVNPRNYIAYFNLFSIFTKIVEDEQALSNLCCSLSCMYLIRAKMNKNIEDVNIAISYSHNNFEAHVLKGLLLLQSNLYQQSKQSFENALSLVPHNEVITHLRNVAIQKGNLEHGQSPIVAKESDKFNYRLMNSYRIVDGCDLNDEIDKKLAQFNRLYIDINTTAGTVTQKVIQDSHLSHKNSQQNIKIIYDSGLSTPLKTSQVHPEPGNIYIRSSIAHQEENASFVSCKRENLNQESFNSIHNEYAEKVQEKYEDVNLQSQQLDKQYGFLPQQAQCEAVKIYEEPMNHQGFQSIISQPEQMQSQLKFEQQAQNSEHYNLIYPLDDNMKLKINVLNLQFLQITEEVQQSLTDVYCIINYNNGKGKLRTAAKQVQGQTCYWNQQFDPVDISQDPAYMKIKIYNKKYKSVRDEFLGDLEVLITTADLLKLPLYSKKGILGNLLIHLQLVEMVPSLTVKAEQEENLLE